jgi:seryl-tRNA synthetase
VIARIAAPALRGASRAAVQGLEGDLAFCHPSITGVAAIDPGEGAIVLELSAPPDDDLEAQVAAVVAASMASYRFVEERPPIWTHDATGPDANGAAETIVLGPGQVALRGGAARLRRRVEERLAAIADAAGAELWYLPSVEMTHDLLEATGYFRSHPMYVTFCETLPRHYEAIHRWARDGQGARVPTGFILQPAVCHNIFRALRGARLAKASVTAQGACYRNEGFRFDPLARQWEFTMRELVFIGTAEHVEEQRLRLLAIVEDLVREWDLGAVLEIASDSFFAATAASPRTFQHIMSSKLELRLRAGGGRTVAAASFNRHGRHFTDAMDIRDERGAPLESVCVAFGLERWVAAMAARHGCS